MGKSCILENEKFIDLIYVIREFEYGECLILHSLKDVENGKSDEYKVKNQKIREELLNRNWDNQIINYVLSLHSVRHLLHRDIEKEFMKYTVYDNDDGRVFKKSIYFLLDKALPILEGIIRKIDKLVPYPSIMSPKMKLILDNFHLINKQNVKKIIGWINSLLIEWFENVDKSYSVKISPFRAATDKQLFKEEDIIAVLGINR
jgi:hypothetical protein